MKEKINGLNDRDLEILDILGFNSSESPLGFLEKNLQNLEVEKLHDKGVALRSVRMILKKIKPYHKMFIKKDNNFYDNDVINLLLSASRDTATLMNDKLIPINQEPVMPGYYW